MTARVETARPDDTVATAREVLRRRRFRQLPVVAAGRVIGMVTDRDLRDGDASASVDAVMTPTPVTTTPATPVEQAARVLRERKFGALPVVEGDTLVGIVSESDLLGALVELCTLLDTTCTVELECAPDPAAPGHVRRLLERHGGQVAWMTAVRTPSDRQRIALRVRMPPSRSAAQLLEESGYPVAFSIAGGALATVAVG